MVPAKGKTFYSYNTKIARWLRKKQTGAEKVLREKLRNKGLDGYKFKRQHGFGSYIVDFYCYSSKLIVEVDGKTHEMKEQKIKDYIKEEILFNSGFKIIRFTNDEVINDVEKVLSEIRQELK
jgi:5-methyltetrahydrofolate--homocysteine methyltransferase